MDLPAVFVRILAVLSLGLAMFWTLYFKGGLNVRTLHPLLMVFAFAFCMPLAVVQFRHPLINGTRHPIKKLMHASLHMLALLALLLGAVFVNLSKHFTGKAHMVSLHSYVGAATITFAVLQFLAGLGFLCLSPGGRKALSVLHKPLGFATNIAGLAVILIGFSKEQSGRTPHKGAAVTVSVIGLVILGLMTALVATLQVPASKQVSPAQQAEPAKAEVPAAAV